MHPQVYSIILPNAGRGGQITAKYQSVNHGNMFEGRNRWSLHQDDSLQSGTVWNISREDENKLGQIDHAVLLRRAGIRLAKCITVCCCHSVINGLPSFPLHMDDWDSSLLLSIFLDIEHNHRRLIWTVICEPERKAFNEPGLSAVAHQKRR